MRVLGVEEDGSRTITLYQSSDRSDVIFAEVSGETIPDDHLYRYSSNLLRPFNLHNKLAFGCKLDDQTVIFKPYKFTSPEDI